MGLTRRDFLTRIGQVGGYSAAFATMQSLGLLPMKGEQAPPIRAEAGVGKGTKVVILGAGIGGLVSAYELKKLGYDVTLLEARERPGGRNWTGRKGTVLEFTDGTKQTVDWQEGNYQNFGCARLPSTHWTMLGYCRELGVPLEVEVNTSRSTLLQNDKANGGKPIAQRKAINDTRGHVSELLAKCVAKGALDDELSAEDRERMLAFLKYYGPLEANGKYIGSARAGLKVAPGAANQVEVIEQPQDMHTLLDESFWNGMLYEETWDWQATMFQPVDGIDHIPYALARQLGPILQLGSPVTEIRKTASGVRVTYTQKGATKQVDAAYCITTLPFSILRRIPNDLSAPYKQVVDNSTMGASLKLCWESPRFWETDYNIYGGLSFLSQGPSPVWYPSAKMFSPNGIVVSGYMDEGMIPGFSDLSMEQKFALSRTSIEKLHPGHGQQLTKPIFCGWKHIKWNEGSWIQGYGGPDGYETILQPDGPIYFAGDTASHVVGWQEGAALSGRRCVDMISDRVKSA
jgi:monoamine oxidase